MNKNETAREEWMRRNDHDVRKPSNKRDDHIDSEGYFVFFNTFYEQKDCEIVASSF